MKRKRILNEQELAERGRVLKDLISSGQTNGICIILSELSPGDIFNLMQDRDIETYFKLERKKDNSKLTVFYLTMIERAKTPNLVSALEQDMIKGLETILDLNPDYFQIWVIAWALVHDPRRLLEIKFTKSKWTVRFFLNRQDEEDMYSHEVEVIPPTPDTRKMSFYTSKERMIIEKTVREFKGTYRFDWDKESFIATISNLRPSDPLPVFFEFVLQQDTFLNVDAETADADWNNFGWDELEQDELLDLNFVNFWENRWRLITGVMAYKILKRIPDAVISAEYVDGNMFNLRSCVACSLPALYTTRTKDFYVCGSEECVKCSLINH